MSKHSPGPWTRERPDDGGYIVRDCTGRTVLADPNMRRLDAVLIEAAPEMLALLRSAVDSDCMRSEDEDMHDAAAAIIRRIDDNT